LKKTLFKVYFLGLPRD